jgi:hypothetical protein
VFVKGYRYRIDVPAWDGSTYGVVLARRPYERVAVLRSLGDPGEILELHWYRSEDDYEAARARPTARVEGVELEEPFPGLLVTPGTLVEELEFEDGPSLAALHIPVGPPPRGHRPDEQARLRALLRALVERLSPALPEGFSLTFSSDSLLLHRELERLDEVGLDWAVEGPDLLAPAVRSALDQLQDTLAEETTDPWPGRGSLPGAAAEVRGDALHLWYGDPDEPVLALEPIPLADLGG